MSSIPRLFCLLAGLALALPAVSLYGQTDQERREAVDRSNRLRQHEQRIQEIIEERRRRALEQEQEQQRRQEEQPEEEERPERQRAVSSVVMGFKFLNEEGVSDYNTIVKEGDTFLTEVVLFNIDENPIERVRLALDFDKRFIEPVRVFDTDIRPNVTGTPEFRLEERDAILVYEASFSSPVYTEEAVLLRILWRALRPTPYAGIHFAFDMYERHDVPHTAIYAHGRNILGVADDPMDGVISGGLMIEPEDRGRILQGKAEELRELYLGSVASDHPVGLMLVGPERPPRVGERFTVRVMLNNPHGALVDAVDFYVKFDPEVLQVIDEDQFNWISRGVNIHDGPFHDFFPWDMHKRNEVRNDRGMINYQKAISTGQTLPSRTMAVIHFVARKPTAQTHVGFIQGRRQDMYRTSVRYFGFDLLELETEISVPALAFPIMPAPAREVAERAPEQPRPPAAVQAEQTRIRPLAIERD